MLDTETMTLESRGLSPLFKDLWLVCCKARILRVSESLWFRW